MKRWLSDRENRTGALVILTFAWAPFWLILARLIDDKTVGMVALWVAVAPFAVGAALAGLVIFGSPFFIAKPLERLAVIPIFAVLGYAAFGWRGAAIYLLAVAAVWPLADGWRAYRAKRSEASIMPAAAAYRHAPHE